MNRIALVLLLVPSLASADRAIVSGKSGTIDCSKDPEVSLQTGEGTFTFTGTCTKIAVQGGNNKITIENVKKLVIVGAGNTIDVRGADKIAITGSDNSVTYKTTTTGKGKTSVGSVGTNNKISKK